MPIIRRTFRFEGQFTQIPNSWLRDGRLSLRAKGLLAQLLSHSDGWSVTMRNLASFNGCGRDAIRSAVRELEEAGYLIRRQDRSEAGEFSEAIWETSEPGADSPVPDYPTTVNPTYKKTKEKNIKIKNGHGESILTEAFETFWSYYPRKVGKAAARDKFFIEGREHMTAILEGAYRISRDPNLPPSQYIPHPATWLNREGWLDEPYPKRETAKPERIEPKSPYVGGPREWVKDLHDEGEHYECRPGEFGCK
jgi:hypothetical protein